MPPTLTIGMATYDDYDGVYFTAQTIRLYHPEITPISEILVIDNHPDGPCAAELKALESWIPGYRYFPWNRTSGTSVRDLIFREAHGDFVLAIDSHVLFVPGALRRLTEYLSDHPDTPDLLQGPLLYDDLRSLSTHMEPNWSDGMFGVWGEDPRAAEMDAVPFEIPMHGLGVFACRRDAWPGFNPRLKGFGCEEGYIHEKFRRAGGRTICLPFLRWIHRFGRPMGTRYENSWEDRIRNYLIVAQELGFDPAATLNHFRTFVGAPTVDAIAAAVTRELENPFGFFDAIYCIRTTGSSTDRFSYFGIAPRVRNFSLTPASSDLYFYSALAHRTIIGEAYRLGLKNVLVFEEGVILANDTLEILKAALRELDVRPWDLLYLGGCRWEHIFPLAKGCQHLEEAGPVTSVHAIAYNASVYSRILDAVPADPVALGIWLARYQGLDQYFASNVPDSKFLVNPIVATTPILLPHESEALRDRMGS